MQANQFADTSNAISNVFLCAGGYSFASMILVAAGITGNIEGLPFMIAGVAVICATLQWCAIWAALGIGAYWRRAILSLVLGSVVALGGSLGIFIGIASSGISNGLESLFFAWGLTPILWMSLQVPNLFWRYPFGWGFVSDQYEPQGFTIGDLMAVTGFAAFSLALVSLLGSFVEIPQMEQQALYGGVLRAMIPLSFLYFLLTAPALYFLRGSRSTELGCGVYAAYLAMTGAVLLGLLIALGNGNSMGEGLVALVSFAGAYAFFLGVPFIVLARNGIHFARIHAVSEQRSDAEKNQSSSADWWPEEKSAEETIWPEEDSGE